MNKKFSSILGVALSLVLVFSLAAAFMPVNQVKANPGNNVWEEFKVPKNGSTGSYVLALAADGEEATMPIGPIAKAIDGTLYLYADPDGTTRTLFKSDDGGLTWSAKLVTNAIIDIATSPDEADVLYYATTTAVFKSINGGSDWDQLQAVSLATNETINSLDAALLGDDYVVVISTADSDSGDYGSVLLFDEGGRTSSSWSDQSVGNYDVYGAALSPNYNSDRQIVAVVNNEAETYVTTRMGSAGWNTSVGNAELQPGNVSTANVSVSAQASIEFPSDYDSDPANGNNNVFVGITDAGSGGDVYKVVGIDGAGNSVAMDLGIGKDITDLAVSGAADTATILAGTAESTGGDKDAIRRSTDGGTTWSATKKEPTGAIGTAYVVMADDYADSGTAWAAIGGTDGGVSLQIADRVWNTVSMINTSIDSISDLSPGDATNGTAYMVTDNGTADSVWKYDNSWDRVFSGSLADASSGNIDMVEVSPDDSDVVFIADATTAAKKLWRSTDGGGRFIAQSRAFDASATIVGWVVINKDRVLIGGDDTNVYRTTNNGQSWKSTSPTSAGNLEYFVLSPDFDNDSTVLAGDAAGRVFRSTTAKSFTELKTKHASMTASSMPAFDPDYASNATMYAANEAGGVFRYVKGTYSTWARIDGLDGSTDDTADDADGLAVASNGALYVIDDSAAGEGMQRTLNPKTGVVSSPYPYFEELNDTSEGTLSSALAGLWLTPGSNQLWSIFGTTKIYQFTDSLVVSPTLTSPTDGSSAGRSDRVTLNWSAVDGADKYEVDVDTQSNFKGTRIVNGDETSDTTMTVTIEAANQGIPLYWRIRVAAGEPFRSLRSSVWSVTSTLVGGQWNPFRTTEGYPGGYAPEAGATGVPTLPTFQWNAADWATGYELVLSLNDTFTSPVASVSLPNSIWQADVELKADTIYFWKVKAVSGDSSSEWGFGSFTTSPPSEPSVINVPQSAPPVVNVPQAAAPPAPVINVPPPVVNIPAAVSPLPLGLIWAIVIIGAVLVIAVIVLIVRTRRVP